MARIRNLKPDFWLDRKLARKLSRDERMLYMGMWNQSDEWGRLHGDPNVLKGAVFPYDDDLSVEVIGRMLDRLVTVGVVQRYVVDDDPYLFLPNLDRHQRLEPGKTPSKLPAPSAGSAPEEVGSEPGAEQSAPQDAEEVAPPAGSSEKIPEQSESGVDESALLLSSYSLSSSIVSSSSSEIPPTEQTPSDDPDDRPDIEALCARLRDRIVENGNREPVVTKKWRTEARLLLDKDGVELTKALALIDWCQRDSFWNSNVMSMPKFREKYDQLRSKALAEHRRQSAHAPPDETARSIREMTDKLARESEAQEH